MITNRKYLEHRFCDGIPDEVLVRICEDLLYDLRSYLYDFLIDIDDRTQGTEVAEAIQDFPSILGILGGKKNLDIYWGDED